MWVVGKEGALGAGGEVEFAAAAYIIYVQILQAPPGV